MFFSDWPIARRLDVAYFPTMTRSDQSVEVRLAYCSVCRGVLSFGRAPRTPGWLRRSIFECERCGTLHRLSDPARAIRRRALRYLIYSGASGMMASFAAASSASLGADHPPLIPQEALITWLLVGLTLGCLLRAAALGLHAADFERLAPWERQELDRRLCQGMIRSDVVDDLTARGWTIGKIRTALASLKPAS